MSSSGVNHLSQPCIYGQVVSSYGERKSRFMKWLSKVFKSGSDRGVTDRQHPQFNGEENMVWRAPARSLDDRSRTGKEREELDRAIALSLAEDLKRPPGYRWQTENNEDLRALQDSLNSPYPPYAPTDYYPRGYRQHSIEVHWYDHYQRVVVWRYGSRWVVEWWRRQKVVVLVGVIVELEGGVDVGCGIGRWRDMVGGSGGCSGDNSSSGGGGCGIIPTNGAGLIEYRCHPFWSQKYCPSHEHDNTARCCSCERLEIHKRPKVGGHRLVGMRTQPQKLTRKCEVTAILVLYGLPRLLTGAILAHELMHGWLRLKGYRNLNPEVEEGICQVLSYMWLESEVMPGSKSMPSTSAASSSSLVSSKKGGKSGVENKLGEFFMHQIAHDASPAYGGGFRAANAAVNKYGLRRTLDHIRLTGSFPL
ncbi:Protein DA1-related like [Actinidia chinensis var. chinensis]|uniref:Protein DA1-related like n=1 Tax=Actinidia chinensis var. chinensis TaxID=1590841 RepID=A0A2R6PLD6_ACTCC|nr:Protein DA1-related like [Actinidia chinensis var. chinensis]